MDVRPHPHINLATVTYLFDGAIDHRDSIGSFPRIEPGAINLMTAGNGIVHSERSPADTRGRVPAFTACRPGSRFPTARRRSTRRSSMSARRPAAGRGRRHFGARPDGQPVGSAGRDDRHSPTIYADLMLDAGASLAIDAEADERAVIVVTEGEASIDGEPIALFDLVILAPGHRAMLRAHIIRSRHAARRRRLRDAAPRLLEFRQLLARPHQPGKGRLEGRQLPARARRRSGKDPATRDPA